MKMLHKLQPCVIRDYAAQDHSRGMSLIVILIFGAMSSQSVDAQSALNGKFVQVAEARSPRTSKQAVNVAYRIFSAPTFPKICAEAGTPVKLVFQTNPLKLTLGSWFPLDTLAVVAVDESGRALMDVPLAIEVEEKSPSLLDLRPEMISKAKLLPIRTGRFRFRVRTFCPGSTIETFIPARIEK
jgi:hypothetical protein